MPRLQIWLLAGILAALSFASATAQSAKIIQARSSGDNKIYEDVRITQDDLRGVKGRESRVGLSFKPEEIVSLEYHQQPEEYRKGRAAYGDGDYKNAAENLLAALEQAERYKWIPVYANWYLAESLRQLGAREQALEAYEAMLKANPIARQAPDAYVHMAEIYMSLGAKGVTPARTALKRLEDMVKREKLGERYSLLAELGLARIEVRAGDPSRAREMLNRIVTAGDRYPKIANLARLELGQLLVKEKKYSEAETFFENILKTTKDDPDVIAGAGNGLGDCQYAQGHYAEAMYTYSRTYALFLDRVDQASRVAHALYYGGRSFRLQAGKETDPAEKSRLEKYGTHVMRRAARDFGGTTAGQMAQKEL